MTIEEALAYLHLPAAYTERELARAHRHFVRLHHPDTHPSADDVQREWHRSMYILGQLAEMALRDALRNPPPPPPPPSRSKPKPKPKREPKPMSREDYELLLDERGFTP